MRSSRKQGSVKFAGDPASSSGDGTRAVKVKGDPPAYASKVIKGDAATATSGMRVRVKGDPATSSSPAARVSGDPASSSGAVRVKGDPSDDVRAMKARQNHTTIRTQSRDRQKAAEDAATRIATEESLRDYDGSKWEQLVSKQEEIMSDGGDTKPSGRRRRTRESRPTPPSPPAPFHTMPAPIPTSLTRAPPPHTSHEDILPGAFRMRPSMVALPAEGLEEGDPGDSRRSMVSKKDILVEAELVRTDGDDSEMPSTSNSTSSSRRSKPIYPEPELVMGEPMSLFKPEMFGEETAAARTRRKRLRWILMAVVLLVGFVVAAACVVAVRSQKQEDPEPTPGSPTETPTMAPTAFTQSVLPAFTQEALEHPSSPQSRAFEWLRKDLKEESSLDMNSYFPLQRFSLATLYYSMRGSGWNDNHRWLEQNTDPCDWFTTFYGTICTNGRRRLRGEVAPRRHYQRLSLFQNNLAGTLPPEMGLLSKLDVVNLHGNDITGTVPSQLGLLQDVTLFQIFNNTLVGSLPTQVGQLSQIRHLNFAFNRLTGTIPTELAQLSSTIQVFSVSNNRVTGAIPTQLGLLTNMVGLHLYGNPHLTGSIPSQLAQMTRLQKLHLQTMELLSGTIPPELGALVELHELQLEDTKIQGTIPSTLGSLTKLTKLTLHNTDLSGSMPSQVCALAQAGTLQTISVDCDKMKCADECKCHCHDVPPQKQQSVYSNGASSPTPPPTEVVVVEAITDPPITVSEAVSGPESTSAAVESTSGAVDGGGPRERPPAGR